VVVVVVWQLFAHWVVVVEQLVAQEVDVVWQFPAQLSSVPLVVLQQTKAGFG
jgi:hypothetical protein